MHVEVSARINKDAEALWRDVGSFQGVGAWHPMLAKVEGYGEQPGAIRTAETPDGRRQVESLQQIDPKNHSYCYVMLSSPVAVRDYAGEFRIRDEGDGTSTVLWSNDFKVTSGDENGVAENIREFLKAGVENLRRKYS